MYSLTLIVGRFGMDVIKVSANSRTSAVAGAIAGVVREHNRAEVQAIGAGAVNQAIKALVLATGYLKGDGIDVACVPEFADVAIDDKVRTAIKLVIEPRK
jgi:stage V sporulation protein S